MVQATASVPGRIRVEIRRLLRFRPAIAASFAIAAAAVAGALALLAMGPTATRGGAGALIVAGLLIGRKGLSALKLEQFRFHKGMLLPGRITCESPLRIALLADLGKGGDRQFYVLADRGFSAAAIPEAKPGDRVALCAVYGPGSSPRAAHWGDFRPAPVQMASGDATVIADALARVPESEWEALDAALADRGKLKAGATVRVDVSSITGAPSGWPAETLGRDMKKCAPVR